MTQTLYYGVVAALSLVLMLVYAFFWHREFETHMTAIFMVIPVSCLSYLLMYCSHTAETAMNLMKIVYIGGIYLPWLITACEVNLCQLKVFRFFKILTLVISTVIYLSVLTIGYAPLFYSRFEIIQRDSLMLLHKEYGPFHTIHQIVLLLYLSFDLAVIFYSLKKQRQVSRRILFLLFLPIPITVFGYLGSSHVLPEGYELTPVLYLCAQLDYLLIARRMLLYNVSELVIASQVQSGDTGFITIDFKGRYLGSNTTAKKYLPQLNALHIDEPVLQAKQLKETAGRWLKEFQEGTLKMPVRYTHLDPETNEETICLVTVSHLYDGQRQCGYQIFLQDDTKNQKYISLLDRYNTDLQNEVAAKTERIEDMHDQLILGMAAMVESRDNSTGGHIRRTSEGVRILIETLKTDPACQLPLSDSFCRNLIKAAPMHDLGKIAVDDAILRKPGRFMPEEYEQMKRHAAEGARIVHEILKDSEEEEFRVLAENVAHYHHERMDGSGYPEGLKGEEIPLEARIMAIADVYDALVSKRVYKEEYSFEKANRIIEEGMGPQFDPQLKSCYEAARPKLEAFYKNQTARAN